MTMEKNKIIVPKFHELINPTFNALKALGGSGNNNEIDEKVIESENYDDKVLSIMQKNTNQTKVKYRLAWARTYLKKYGVINNTSRGIWVLNSGFEDKKEFDIEKLVKQVRKLSNRKKVIEDDIIEIPTELESWRTELKELLLSIPPFEFEKLIQLLLRESGFSQVEITKKTGDGGIDGFGKFQINGIISFKLAFQCKRYKGMVKSPEIRNFRGSITTDVERGVLITTGGFTRDAIKEAEADGKKHIDLIDGEQLIDKLAQLKLGVKEKTTYEVDHNFFKEFNINI